MTPTERNAVLEEAARLAELYAETNAEQMGDTILIDPILSGGARTPENFAKSESLMIDGCVHSSMYHAATNIAAAIRSLKTPEPVPGETDGWRSMDSAPRDGTEILLWSPTDADGPSAYKVAMWDSVHREWIEPWDAPHVHEAPDSYALIGFTHWQPLPSPPRVVTPPVPGEWIPWEGGECPLEKETIVEVEFRDHVKSANHSAAYWEWRHVYGRYDIIAYRVVTP